MFIQTSSMWQDLLNLKFTFTNRYTRLVWIQVPMNLCKSFLLLYILVSWVFVFEIWLICMWREHTVNMHVFILFTMIQVNTRTILGYQCICTLIIWYPIWPRSCTCVHQDIALIYWFYLLGHKQVQYIPPDNFILMSINI